MASVSGSARGTVRALAAAAIGAIVLACAASPVLAAPTDRGLEELWREFPLDARAPSPVPSQEPAGDRSQDVPAPAARRSAQPAAPDKASPADDGSDELLAFMTIPLLLVLGVAGLAFLVLRLQTAPRAGRRSLAVGPLLASLARSLEHGPRQVGLAVVGAREHARTPASPRLASRVVEDLTRAARAAQSRIERRGIVDRWVDRHRRTTPEATTETALDEPTTRESRERVAEGDALKAAPDALKLKHAADEPTTRELRERDAARLALKADPDAPKLKRVDAHAIDPLKLKRPADEPDGATPEAVKEKLAAPPDEPDASRLKRSVTDAARPRLAQGTRPPALRPVPDAAAAKRDRQPLQVGTRAVECEIRHWRGYATSRFYALAADLDGTETIVGSSPPFRWLRKNLPETPAAAAALSALVESLQRDGWRVAGREGEWFALRMRQSDERVDDATAGADR